MVLAGFEMKSQHKVFRRRKRSFLKEFLVGTLALAKNQIEHAHGILLTHKVAEEDGHKVLRVCAAGDTFLWTVRPIANELVLSPSDLSGLFTKYVNGVEQQEKVVLTVHDDYSFQMVLNVPTLLQRLEALETAFAELTNA